MFRSFVFLLLSTGCWFGNDFDKFHVSNDASVDRPGGPAMLTIDATALSFGTVSYAQTTTPKTVHLRNDGGSQTGALTISVMGMNAADFAKTSDCPSTIDGGGSCSIQVTVTASQLGGRMANLQIDAAPGGSFSVPLSAMGDYAYSDLSDATKWTTFGPNTVDSNASLFAGAAFDKRYLYFIPRHENINGTGIRYDAQLPFGMMTSWTPFVTTSFGTGADSFFGSVFDGRYLYLVPSNNGNPYGTMLRYDSRNSITSAWMSFDVTTVDANAKGFMGGAFDGRYVYYAPNFGSVLARYDTQPNQFDVATSWTTFDTTTVDPNAKNFQGAVFDGRYIYFVPTNHLVARYDTQAPLSMASSWLTFDLTPVDANSQSFAGAAFDGRYVYFVPFVDRNSMGSGGVVRYDSQAPSFTNAAAWSAFDLTTIDPNAKGFAGAAFDGRFIYFVPLGLTTVARYDTLGSFSVGASWSTLALTGANGYWGAAFDGEAIYLVPFGGNGLVRRFEARAPLGPLPQLCSDATKLFCFSGSFF